MHQNALLSPTSITPSMTEKKDTYSDLREERTDSSLYIKTWLTSCHRYKKNSRRSFIDMRKCVMDGFCALRINERFQTDCVKKICKGWHIKIRAYMKAYNRYIAFIYESSLTLLLTLVALLTFVKWRKVNLRMELIDNFEMIQTIDVPHAFNLSLHARHLCPSWKGRLVLVPRSTKNRDYFKD